MPLSLLLTGHPAGPRVVASVRPHGSILDRFLATGGVARWGFPVSDETTILSGRREVGRSSEFEQCTFYWSAATGAHEVHGNVRLRYRAFGGPTGPLGLPTSDQGAVPGAAGAEGMNSFQNASIVSYGTFANTIAVGRFRLFVQSLNTDESEGFGRGQNDLYIRVTIRQGSTILHRQKYPPSGDWGGRNVRDVNVQLPTVLQPAPGVTFDLSVDLWENDSGGPFSNSDDHLGEWTVRLDGSNGWGLRTNSGILDSGSFRKVNNIRVAVQPSWQDPATLTDENRFWGVKNTGTDVLSRTTFANAFRDVDSDTEWWDVEDWLHKAFYELVVEGLAKDGNCFGMSLEAIYASKGNSAFSQPLARFTSFATIEPVINVKHAYQVGAAPIWWFVGQFLSGNTHDPKDVFDRTKAAFDRGEPPVLCISQDYDFSGEPHCILPVAWRKTGASWTMTIMDPNFPRDAQELTVDPGSNTFRYQGKHLYEGGAWSGGRMHYMPFGILDHAPRTPVWDAIMLLLTGTVVILADSAETESITDADGTDLDAASAAATRMLRVGDSTATSCACRASTAAGSWAGSSWSRWWTRADRSAPVARPWTRRRRTAGRRTACRSRPADPRSRGPGDADGAGARGPRAGRPGPRAGVPGARGRTAAPEPGPGAGRRHRRRVPDRTTTRAGRADRTGRGRRLTEPGGLDDPCPRCAASTVGRAPDYRLSRTAHVRTLDRPWAPTRVPPGRTASDRTRRGGRCSSTWTGSGPGTRPSRNRRTGRRGPPDCRTRSTCWWSGADRPD